MDDFLICQESVYSDQFVDYILDVGGDVRLAQWIYNTNCVQNIDGSFAIIYMDREINGDISFEKYGYAAVPKCFGLLDTSSVEATGALKLRRRPNFDLSGSGVLVGFIDTGIDYLNPLFQYGDGSTRIAAIWDQTERGGTPPANIYYGAEYGRDSINLALQSENPLQIVPEQDEIYHGTYLAAIAAGNEDQERDFTGMVPEAELLVVKVKQAKKNLREFYGIPDGVPCYQENDIMMAIRYLWVKSAILRKPIVICIGMGSNAGGHNGFSPIGTMINRVGNLNGICVVCGAGNETNMGHHFASVISSNNEEIAEINVDKRQGMTVEVWTNAATLLSVGITTPQGEYSERIAIRSHEQLIDFVFSNTKVYVYYQRIEEYSGDEVVTMRFQDMDEGIWKIHIYNLEEEESGYHIWLPMREFVADRTRFLDPSPDTIVCNPGNTYQVITVGAYNHRNDSIFVNSSRGFTANHAIKPDLVAPGVSVYGPVSRERYGERSGTSVAAAHTAGAVAMLLQWAFIKRNNLGMNTTIAKNYLIRGARKENLVIPDRSFGWGILDVYNIFNRLTIY